MSSGMTLRRIPHHMLAVGCHRDRKERCTDELLTQGLERLHRYIFIPPPWLVKPHEDLLCNFLVLYQYVGSHVL